MFQKKRCGFLHQTVIAKFSKNAITNLGTISQTR